MRLALALNFTDKEGFLKSMRDSGIDPTKLAAIFDNEVHQSIQMDGLESAKKLQMNTKVWDAPESCCKDMNGEEVPINANFSNGKLIAHGRDGCQCSTSYKKGDMKMSEDKIYTKGEIGEMSPQEYSIARDVILEQYASGKIK